MLTRDPILRYESFCAHSTRDYYGANPIKKRFYNKPLLKTAFWHNEQYMYKPISCEGWLSGSLDRIERRLLAGVSTSLESIDDGLIFSVYSQWYLATLKSSFNPKTNSFTYCGADYFKHIAEMRKNSLEGHLHMRDFMAGFLRGFYSVVGSLERVDAFISRLVDEGIFNSRPTTIPRENNSSLIRKRLSNRLSINGDRLMTRYYSLIPEDFFLNIIAKELISA